MGNMFDNLGKGLNDFTKQAGKIAGNIGDTAGKITKDVAKGAGKLAGDAGKMTAGCRERGTVCGRRKWRSKQSG